MYPDRHCCLHVSDLLAKRNKEQRLKQQMAELRIEVDKSKQAKQVSQITGSDYFKQLRGQVNELRQKMENVDE